MADSKMDMSRSGSAVYYLGKRETTAERVRRQQAEAKIMAREHVEQLEKCLMSTAEVAREIAEGGEAYPVGVREMASRLSEDLPEKLVSLRSLNERAGKAKL
jgi:DNA-binding PucR family transcriptional regulator